MLHGYVSKLRNVLEPGRGPGAASDVLVSEPRGYRLVLQPGQVDLDRFERLFADGRSALVAGRAVHAAQTLRKAVEVSRGVPLADFRDAPWAQRDIARLEEMRLACVEAWIDAELALGCDADLVVELEALVGANPLRERLRAQLMLALYRSGRQADALAAYRDARTALLDELGLDPSRALQELERAILRHDAALDGRIPRRGDRFEPPEPPGPLFGREAELAEAAAALRSDTRLLTLTGPGGIGKSRLALELARVLAPEYARGAAFVRLEALADPHAVEREVAVSLGLDENEPVPQQLRDCSLLLVLDNYEHVVEAAPLAAEIVAAAPAVRVVVTSRCLLRLRAERALVVPPLAPDEAVSLFVVRARACEPEFAADGHEAVIGTICKRLDCLPLAIELAAARTTVLSPGALLERLTRRLDVLTAGSRDAPTRQQTMRATLEWSFDLLDPDERRLLLSTAVFAGGASVAAVTAVAGYGLERPLDRIASVVEHSLLRRDGGAEPRVAMLELVRDYALERLASSGEEASVRRRHLRFFVAMADAAQAALHSPAQHEWFERLERESDNLRVALRFALDSADSETALLLASKLEHFWRVHGHLAEGRRWLADAIASGSSAPPGLLSEAWSGIGRLAVEQDDVPAATRAFEQALAYARRHGDPVRAVVPLANLALLTAVYGHDLPAARARFAEALQMFRSFGDARGAATALLNLGTFAIVEGDADGAVALLEESLAEASAAGDAHSECSALIQLARVHVSCGRPDASAPLLERGLPLAAGIGARHKIAQVLDVVAAVAAARGAADDAASFFGAASAARGEIGALRPPDQRAWLEGLEADVRGALDVSAYADAFARGRHLWATGRIGGTPIPA